MARILYAFVVPTGSQSALEDCSRAVHDYLKLLRAVSSQGSPSDIKRCLHKVQAVIGPLSHLKPDIGRGTKVFGSKDCLLAQHAMLAVHLTTAACLQRMSVETVDNQHMVQFLAWCAVQRSKVVDRVSGNLLNCFCVKTCWRLAFQVWSLCGSADFSFELSLNPHHCCSSSYNLPFAAASQINNP